MTPEPQLEILNDAEAEKKRKEELLKEKFNIISRHDYKRLCQILSKS